jgi:ADP-ribose pyrophosphatase YjhB (NUDIX family)
MSKPVFCADAIAFDKEGNLVLIERLTEPLGYALPGGRLEPGEVPEQTAVREFEEETGMEFLPVTIVGTYGQPGRDPRGHYVTTVIAGRAEGVPKPEAGKTRVVLVQPSEVGSYLPRMVNDHGRILQEFLAV